MSKYWPIALGFALGGIALAAALISTPSAAMGWARAACWTGRVAFPLFLPIFVASALVSLSPRPWTRALLRDRRAWGLGFAGCLAVHLLALWIDQAPQGQPAMVTFVSLGGLAYLLLLAMSLTSTRAWQRRLGRQWKRLHRLGMWVLLAAFVQAGPPRFERAYLLLALAAVALRLAAWRHRRHKRQLAH